MEKAEQNEAKLVPNTPNVLTGTHCMNSAAIRAAVTPDPEGPVKWFKIPEHKPVAPDPASAGRAL